MVQRQHILFKLILQYEKAAAVLSSHDPPVILAKVDANEEKNKELASEFEVKGFPTIKILRNGGKNIQDYKGPRDADGIVNYLKKQNGSASSEIKSVEDARALLDGNKIVVVSSLCFLVFCFQLYPSMILDIKVTFYVLIGWCVPRILWREV